MRHAIEHGIRAAARHYQCSRNTVRLWLSRHQEGDRTLADHSQRPHNNPNKTPKDLEGTVIAARKKTPCFGAHFLASAVTYQTYFNYARRNRSRSNKTPAQLLREKSPHLNPLVLHLPPQPPQPEPPSATPQPSSTPPNRPQPLATSLWNARTDALLVEGGLALAGISLGRALGAVTDVAKKGQTSAWASRPCHNSGVSSAHVGGEQGQRHEKYFRTAEKAGSPTGGLPMPLLDGQDALETCVGRPSRCSCRQRGWRWKGVAVMFLSKTKMC